MNAALSLICSLLPVATTIAQVVPGDLAMTTFSTNEFGVASGGTTDDYDTFGFGGSGAATSQAIVHDPLNPNDFLVGGFGFIGRATIVGPNTVNYTVLNQTVGSVSQMSWDQNGNLVFVDSTTNQVRLMTPGGVVIDLSTGAQPWGTTLNAGIFDPNSGDVIVGNDGGIYRLAVGAATGTLVADNLGGSVTSVQIDPCTGDILALVLTTNRLVRVDANGNVSDVVPPSTVVGGNAMEIDSNGDFLVGASFGEVWRVTRDGTASIYAVNQSSLLPINGLAFAREAGRAAPFGTPCDGPGGPTWMSIDGDYSPNGTITTISQNHAPAAIGVVVFAVTRLVPAVDLGPVLGAVGCELHCALEFVEPVLTDGSGTLTFSFQNLPAFAGATIYGQHAVIEGTSLSDLTTSNAACFEL